MVHFVHKICTDQDISIVIHAVRREKRNNRNFPHVMSKGNKRKQVKNISARLSLRHKSLLCSVQYQELVTAPHQISLLTYMNSTMISFVANRSLPLYNCSCGIESLWQSKFLIALVYNGLYFFQQNKRRTIKKRKIQFSFLTKLFERSTRRTLYCNKLLIICFSRAVYRFIYIHQRVYAGGF